MGVFSRQARSKASRSTLGHQMAARRRATPASNTQGIPVEPVGRAFRRNNTLTGSSSSRVSSSAELNAQLVSPRAHTHTLSRTRRQLASWFVIVSMLASGTYILLSQLVANVTVVIAAADPLSSSQQAPYRQTLTDYYAARPAERLRLLLDHQALLAHMQAAHPEIEKIKLIPDGLLNETILRIQARSAVARWDIASQNTYVDDSGVVFTRNYYKTPSLRIVDNSGVRIGGNKVLASNRFLGFIGRIAGLSEANDVRITQVTIPAQSTRQVEVRAKKSGGVTRRYILSIDRLAGEQAEDMVRTYDYMTRKGIEPAYVDIRVKGKAFYK